jgi:MFS family permease
VSVPGRSPLRALGFAGYRSFILSQVTSNGGMWMHRTALTWLVVEISGGDGVAVGVVSGLQYVAMIVLGLGGGALGDRFDKRRMMLATQALVVLASLTLGVLIDLNLATLPMAYVFAVLLGVPNAIEAPLRLAYPRQLVPHEFLAPAVGLNGAVFQVSRVAGPAVAGGLIAWYDTAVAFYTVAGLGALSCLSLWRVRPVETEAEDRPGGGAAAGWRAVLRRPYLVPLAGSLMLGVGIGNVQLALPLLVDPGGEGAAGAFGTLSAMIGVGGIIGAGLTAMVRSEPTDARMLGWAAVFAVVMFVVAVLPAGPPLGAGLFVTGLTMQIFGTSAISSLQLRAPADIQGRVMALYVIVFFIWFPVGGPVFGWFANLAGVRVALGVSALACLAVLGGLAVAARWAGRGRDGRS